MTIQRTSITKEKVTENTVTISFAAWSTSDQLCCTFDNIGGGGALSPMPSHCASLGNCEFSFIRELRLMHVESVFIEGVLLKS